MKVVSSFVYLSLFVALVICISCALDVSLDSFVIAKGVEIILSRTAKIVSSQKECAMYCTTEITCCRASFNARTRECHITSDCSSALKMSNGAIMLQKGNSLGVTDCETGWIHNGLSCYFFSVGNLTWDQAKADCLSRGGYLSEVTTFNELIFLRNMVQNLQSGFWIGASDEQEEGVWVWETSKDPVTLSDWNHLQPDNHKGIQDCGCINLNGWDDLGCFNSKQYLCEQPAS